MRGPDARLGDRPAWLRYAIGIAFVALGWLARQALSPVIGPTALPYIFFFPAVALAAWFGRVGPGILAIALSALAAIGFFMDGSSPFAFDLAATMSFIVSAAFIVAAIGGMHWARARLHREIEDQKRLRAELEVGQHLLATTLASIGDGVIATDGEGRITFMNAEAERLTGWRNAEATNAPLESVFRVVEEETHAPVESPIGRALSLGTTVALASRSLLVAKNGAETPIDDTASPIREPGGPIAGAVLVFRGVAEQRKAQEAHARLATIVEYSTDAIFTKGLDGIIRTWNKGAENLFGYRADEIVGKSILLLIPPECVHEEPYILSRLRTGLPIDRMETVRLTKDGRRLFVSISVSPLKDSTGRVTGASKIVHDVTDIVLARRALEQERKLLATTLASIGDAVIVTDVEGRVAFLNLEAERLTGWRSSEAVGQELSTVFRIVNERTRETVENPVEKVLRIGQVVGLANHTILIRRDGSETPIDDSAAPIGQVGGEFHGVVLVFRDITERKRAETALQESDRRKDEFLAILSHELRNPLAPIRLAVAMLRRTGPAAKELQELREIIERQTSHLSRLLDDLLDVSRISSGKITLRKDRISLNVAVASAVESSRPLIDSFGHRLEVDLPETPLHVEADVTRLAQVFMNLLNNAAKYTEKGGRVRLSAVREDGEAVIRVRDDGIGLTPDQIPRIFEMFAQVDASLDRTRDGLGVGLSLAKRLVELHGGHLEAKSDGLGKGSEFIVRLPVVDVTEPRARPIRTSESTVPPRRILVVDDNQDAAISLSMLLRLDGHTVVTAGSGQEALALAGEFRPAVVFLDIGMPAMNGYEVASRIRGEDWGRSVVLVALTGWGAEDDKRRASEAGFDHHLTKPVEADGLQEILESAIRGADSGGRA